MEKYVEVILSKKDEITGLLTLSYELLPKKLYDDLSETIKNDEKIKQKLSLLNNIDIFMDDDKLIAKIESIKKMIKGNETDIDNKDLIIKVVRHEIIKQLIEKVFITKFEGLFKTINENLPQDFIDVVKADIEKLVNNLVIKFMKNTNKKEEEKEIKYNLEDETKKDIEFLKKLEKELKILEKKPLTKEEETVTNTSVESTSDDKESIIYQFIKLKELSMYDTKNEEAVEAKEEKAVAAEEVAPNLFGPLMQELKKEIIVKKLIIENPLVISRLLDMVCELLLNEMFTDKKNVEYLSYIYGDKMCYDESPSTSETFPSSNTSLSSNKSMPHELNIRKVGEFLPTDNNTLSTTASGAGGSKTRKQSKKRKQSKTRKSLKNIKCGGADLATTMRVIALGYNIGVVMVKFIIPEIQGYLNTDCNKAEKKMELYLAPTNGSLTSRSMIVETKLDNELEKVINEQMNIDKLIEKAEQDTKAAEEAEALEALEAVEAAKKRKEKSKIYLKNRLGRLRKNIFSKGKNKKLPTTTLPKRPEDLKDYRNKLDDYIDSIIDLYLEKLNKQTIHHPCNAIESVTNNKLKNIVWDRKPSDEKIELSKTTCIHSGWWVKSIVYEYGNCKNNSGNLVTDLVNSLFSEKIKLIASPTPKLLASPIDQWNHRDLEMSKYDIDNYEQHVIVLEEEQFFNNNKKKNNYYSIDKPKIHQLNGIDMQPHKVKEFKTLINLLNNYRKKKVIMLIHCLCGAGRTSSMLICGKMYFILNYIKVTDSNFNFSKSVLNIPLLFGLIPRYLDDNANIYKASQYIVNNSIAGKWILDNYKSCISINGTNASEPAKEFLRIEAAQEIREELRPLEEKLNSILFYERLNNISKALAEHFDIPVYVMIQQVGNDSNEYRLLLTKTYKNSTDENSTDEKPTDENSTDKDFTMIYFNKEEIYEESISPLDRFGFSKNIKIKGDQISSINPDGLSYTISLFTETNLPPKDISTESLKKWLMS